MLKNPTVNIHLVDPMTGVNCFWLAANFGNGHVMKILAENGIDTLNTHSKTLSNALHIAVENKNKEIVELLIQSNFPLDKTKKDNITALISSCLDKESEDITKMLLKAGADPSVITTKGSSALAEAVNQENLSLIKLLLRKGAQIHNTDNKH